MAEKTMKKMFETVLDVNRDYVEALAAGASADEQETLLELCKLTYVSLILDAGLAREYKDYCDMKIAVKGQLW